MSVYCMRWSNCEGNFFKCGLSYYRYAQADEVKSYEQIVNILKQWISENLRVFFFSPHGNTEVWKLGTFSMTDQS